MTAAKRAAPITAFVHLAYGFDATAWEARWRDGTLLGINERLPYGYNRAEDYGFKVQYSTDRTENLIGKALRYAARFLLGFDFVHAYRNRTGILDADVVWTHTESQYLAIGLLFKILRPRRRPKLLGQSVWIMDAWHRFGPPRRWFYDWLIGETDVLTFHSPLNLARAVQAFPGRRCQLVRFGISSEHRAAPMPRRDKHVLRVLALGNDRHRDWTCLIDALGGLDGIEVTICSQMVSRRAINRFGNIKVMHPSHNVELEKVLTASDVMVVPLTENLHASGLTVVQEAASFGLPIVCSRVGGLDAYFPDDSILFVPPRSPQALRAAIQRLQADPDFAFRLAARAQAHLSETGLNSLSYILDHVRLSRDLLDEDAGRPARTGGKARPIAGSDPQQDHPRDAPPGRGGQPVAFEGSTTRLNQAPARKSR